MKRFATSLKIFFSMLLLLFFVKPIKAQAPLTEWAGKIGGSGVDQGNSMVIDASGNMYVAGMFSGTVDFDPSAATAAMTSVGSTNIFFAKYDSNGNYMWAKCITGGTITTGRPKIAVDISGNVFISGSVVNGYTYDFDPSAATANFVSVGGEDIYIAKYNSNGGFIWVKQIGTSSLERVQAIDVDASGNVYTTGIFRSTVDFDPGAAVFNLTENNTGSASDIFISKLSSTGDFVWAKSIGGTSWDSGFGIKVDAVNVYVTGHFSETVDFDPGSGVYSLGIAGSAQSAFVLKLTQAGVFVWARNTAATTTYTTEGLGIETDASGNVYSCGTFSGPSADFDPGIGSVMLTNSGGYTTFISKLNANGDFVWAKKIEGSSSAFIYGKDLTLDLAGNIYISCDFDETAMVELTSGIMSYTAVGNSDVILAKLDVNGSYLWAKHFGGTGVDNVTSINSDASGNLFLTGYFLNSVAFDAINLLSSGNSDVFLMKIGTSVCSSTTSTISASHCSTYTVPSGHETYTVSGTYTDTIPNAAGCDSIITINLTISDGIAPVADISSLPNITNQCSVTSLTAPTATDNCAGTITGTHNATLPITTQGTTVVTWTYNDGHGNSSTQTQNVIIVDNTAPVANAANLSDITGQCSVTNLTAPTATDNCAGTVTGITTTTLPITTPGTTLVMWTYNDGHGNSSTQTQNVVISVPVATTALSGLTITATTSGATYQWINCGTGNTPIAGATAQSFTATANGTYAVIVTQNGCSATSACVTISTVGLDELPQTTFTVYPNPNNGTFKIVTELQTTITITNASGQLITTQLLGPGENTIELTNAESGIYFITARDLNGAISLQRVTIIK